MKIWLLILLALNPLCASAQGVVYVPSPVIPGQLFGQYGVMISPQAGNLREYAIDLDGDGVVDYTLSVTHAQDAGISSVWQFNIVPSGSNCVLAIPESGGVSDAANLWPGAVIGPEGSSTTPAVWLNNQSSFPPILNYFIDLETLGQTQWVFGTFAGNTGFIGLKFWANGQAHYGFLQMDCRFDVVGPLDGGLYQGYGWNTTPGEPITTTYFRDRFYPPGPSIQYIAGPAFYVPVNSDPVSLDMNADGTADAIFSGVWLQTTDYPSSESAIACNVSGANGAQLLITNGYAQILSAGKVIGNSPDWSAGTVLLTAENFNMLANTSSGWLGPLGAKGQGYLGIQFIAADGSHYGWIQVRLLDASGLGSFPQVVDWAFQTVPNKPILAGEKPIYFEATFTGANEVPPNQSTYSGTGTFTLEGETLNYSFTVDSSLNFTSAGIYGPATPSMNSRHLVANLGSGSFSNLSLISSSRVGSVPFDLNPFPPTPGAFLHTGQIALNSIQVAELLAGCLYVNFTSAAFPRGELRGQIVPLIAFQFTADLKGANEIPRKASPYHGTGTFTLSGSQLTYYLALDAVLGQVSAGVFYGPSRLKSDWRNPVFNLDTSSGVLIPEGGFPGVPGSPGQMLYSGTLNLTDEQAAWLRSGELSVNVSTTQFPRVLIRGQILPVDSDHNGVPDWISGFIGEVYPCDAAWRNHGQYVNSVSRLAAQFVVSDMITWQQYGQIVRQAQGSHCGNSR